MRRWFVWPSAVAWYWATLWAQHPPVIRVVYVAGPDDPDVWLACRRCGGALDDVTTCRHV